MQWFRLYGEFSHDPKIQMMSEPYQRRFIMLLCLKCNEDVTLHDKEIAFQLRVTEAEWADTKTDFVQRGLIDDHNNLTNWDKRQKPSDSSAERVKAHRERKKSDDVTDCNVTVTSQTRPEKKDPRPVPLTARGDPVDNSGSGSFRFAGSGGRVGSSGFDIRQHMRDDDWLLLRDYCPLWDKNAVCEKYNAFVASDPPKKPIPAFTGWLKKNANWLAKPP